MKRSELKQSGFGDYGTEKDFGIVSAKIQGSDIDKFLKSIIVKVDFGFFQTYRNTKISVVY